MTKEKALEAVRQLPEDFTINQLIDRLLVIEGIEAGRKDFREGKVKTLEEARILAKQWGR